jgi:hypothetical protein
MPHWLNRLRNVLEQCFWRALWRLMQWLEIQVDLGRYAGSPNPFKVRALQYISEMASVV